MSQVKLAQVKLARVKSKQKSAAKPARRSASRGKPAATGNDAALAAFAHDFRTALTGILALGELLASSNLGERERLWAAGIKGSAEHLAALTTLVIDAAKADAGGITLQREAFSPRRSHRGAGGNARRARGDEGPRRRSRDRRRFAGNADRRSGAAARGAGKSHRQRGEIHRRAARCGSRRGRRAPRAAKSSSPSPSPTAASGLTPPRSSGCSGRSRRPTPRSRGAMAAPASASPWSSARQADGRRSHRHQHAGPRLRVSALLRCCRSRRPTAGEG